MKNIVEVKQLNKSYHGKMVVKELSFSMKENEFLALLGPNGAGKSTTISILCSLLDFDSGDIKVCGFTLGKEDLKIRKHIGIVFQNSVLDNILSVHKNLRLRCGFYGLNKKEANARVEQLSKLCGLDDFIYQKVSTLSGGQRRKVDIARALIPKPSLLILDEPTTGLDPNSRVQIWKTIEKLRAEEAMSILLTTHYMEEAEKADKIIIVNHGEIVIQGSVEQLIQQYVKGVLKLYTDNRSLLQSVLEKHQINYHLYFEHIEINLMSTRRALSILQRVEPYINHFEMKLGSLEDVFLSIIKGDKK